MIYLCFTARFRLLLRREQVLKVACNHYISLEMSLQPLATSETAWCWFAVDYAEGEAKNEQLAVRFKTKDLACQFKEVFTKCQEELKSGVQGW
jgi:E3 SUMO-protein ligase RanBP2